MSRYEGVPNEALSHLYRLAAEHLQDYLDPDVMGVPEESLGDALDPPLFPEAFGGDRHEMVQHRMVQRIAIGFWQQAEGSGFDRLRAAIAASEQASELQLTEADLVPEDEAAEPGGVLIAPEPIPNALLSADQVPNYTVTMLDPIGFNSGEMSKEEGSSANAWWEIWTFALTFDGYRYFGNDGESLGRLSSFARSIENSFQRSGELPAIDLAMLRACLFFQQRLWCKWGGVMTRRCPPETAKFLDALLRAIRASIN